MLKKMLLLGLVLSVAAHPQGTHRVRRYYYNEDRDLQSNEHSRRANDAVKGGASTAAQSSNSYGSGIYPEGNNGKTYSQGYPQGNSGHGAYRRPYAQETDGRGSYTQMSDHSFDQGRNLYRQDQISQGQKSHSGGYKEFGY